MKIFITHLFRQMKENVISIKRLNVFLYISLFTLGFLIIPNKQVISKQGNIGRVDSSTGEKLSPKQTVNGLYPDGSYALLIGVYLYDHWGPLINVKTDIENIRKILEEKHGFNVEVSMNPTGEELRKKLEEFIAMSAKKPNARFLLYFGGHGILKDIPTGQMGYIIPSDAPSSDNNIDGFKLKALSLERIKIMSKEIESKHVLFIFDSCYSGSILFKPSTGSKGEYENAPLEIQKLTTYQVRQFITSGDAHETVSGSSLFANQLIIALNGNADIVEDHYITGTELGMFLQKEVFYESQTDKKVQYPQYGKIEDDRFNQGEFIFLAPEKNSTPTPTPVIEGEGQRMEPTPLSASFPTPTHSPTFEFQNQSMVKIPAGEFTMGSDFGDDDERPVRRVFVDTFYIEEHEVTVKEYKNAGFSPTDESAGENAPIVLVSWDEAQRYCERVGKRLPTEAEWEKAARGGLDGMSYSWGNEKDRYKANDRSNDIRPVKSFPTNGYRLYDMAGNVSEWVQDWYAANFYSQYIYQNPHNQDQNSGLKVIRDGSFMIEDYVSIRVADRGAMNPNERRQFIGFRCARDE